MNRVSWAWANIRMKRNGRIAFFFALLSSLAAILPGIAKPPQVDNVKSKSLPSGVLQALAAHEKDYCYQFSFKNCRQTFQANLLWDELVVSPQGQTAILVENRNIGFCGSAGCALYLFLQRRDMTFVQVLGAYGEVGALDKVKVLKSVSGGYYNLQKTWRDGKTRTIYGWDGERYTSY